MKATYGWMAFCWVPGPTPGIRPDGSQMDCRKVWCFANPKIGEQILKRFPNTDVTPDCGPLYEPIRLAKEAEELQRKMETATYLEQAKALVVNDHDGKPIPLKDYQRAAIMFINLIGGNALLAIPPGGGKTLTALAWAALNGITKILVVCPATVKLAWQEETAKWLAKAKVFVISAKHLPTQKDFEENDIFIINYDILFRFKDLLAKFPFGALIADESSRVKSPQAKMTKALTYLAKKIGKSIALNGTPIMNRLDELYSQINIVKPGYFGTKTEFLKRYCGGSLKEYEVEETVMVNGVQVIKKVKKKRWAFDNPADIAELKKKLKGVMIHFEKSDIMADLPPKVYRRIIVELSEAERAEYDRIEDDFIEWLNDRKPLFDADGVRIPRTAMNELAQLSALRAECSRMKIPSVLDHLEDIKDAGDKALVFSFYKAPLDEMAADYGPGAVVLHGGKNAIEKANAKDAFQLGDAQVLFGSVGAAGVGLTLTAASEVLFLDYQWTPATHTQCEDRCHRQGVVHDSINVTYFYAPNTIDERIVEVLEAKKRLIGSVLSSGNNSDTSAESQVLNSYRDINF